MPVTSRAGRDAALTIAGSLAIGLLIVRFLGGGLSVQVASVLAGMVVPTVAAASILRRRPRTCTGADRVTLLRGVLAGACASIVVLSLGGDVVPLRSWPLFLLALPAVLLDVVDGWMARRSATSSDAGARLDMETDAALILILAVPLSFAVGPWILAIGAMRYLFVVARWWRPVLGRPLLFSPFRRMVAGIQGVALVAAVCPVMPIPVAAVATGVALLLLVVSFGRDVIALECAKDHQGENCADTCAAAT